MSLILGKGNTFIFGGEVIGGVDTWQEQAGKNPEINTNFLGRYSTQPGQHEFGRITLNVFRKNGDAGQDKLSAALVNGSVFEMSITDDVSGYTATFDAYVVSFGISASDTGAGTTPCVLRMASSVI